MASQPRIRGKLTRAGQIGAIAMAASLTAFLAVPATVDAVSAHHGVSTHPTAKKAKKLSGTVGPSMTISMSKSTTTAGAYTITIHDKSSAHNFHLTGPGVDKKTSIPGTGTTTWNVTLSVGTYHYKCDAHPTTMKGNLKVTAS